MITTTKALYLMTTSDSEYEILIWQKSAKFKPTRISIKNKLMLNGLVRIMGRYHYSVQMACLALKPDQRRLTATWVLNIAILLQTNRADDILGAETRPGAP